MTKSKQSLKNLINCVLLLNVCIFTCLILGCFPSTNPTYLKEDIPEAIEDICKKEYQIDVKAKLVNETLWLYLPVEDMFTGLDKKTKPEKYVERFTVEHNEDTFENDTLKFEYKIKAIPEQEKYQEYKIDENVFKKANNVLTALRRVLFSMDRAKAAEPKFICLIIADINNGFQIKEVFYYLDLKKVSYQFISFTEYQHRTIQDIEIQPAAIGDKEGLYINYKDITLPEFITDQIKYRIKLKFQKPEVDKNVDIDKEILKIVVYTIKTYDFKDFLSVEFNNLLTGNRMVLNQQAILAHPLE